MLRPARAPPADALPPPVAPKGPANPISVGRTPAAGGRGHPSLLRYALLRREPYQATARRIPGPARKRRRRVRGRDRPPHHPACRALAYRAHAHGGPQHIAAGGLRDDALGYARGGG